MLAQSMPTEWICSDASTSATFEREEKNEKQTRK